MTRIRSFVVAASAVLCLTSVAPIGARAEGAKVVKPAKKLDARGELLVKLAGTELPAGLEAEAKANANAIAVKLSKGDTDGALADWKTFVQTHGKKLGKGGIEQVGHWLVRTGVLEPASELADPADRVRFARQAAAQAKNGIAKLSTAKAHAAKSKAPVTVKLVKVAVYQKGKPAASDVAAKLTAAQLASEIDALQGSVDAMSEMGEMESLRLQMTMDRMSKMMSTLSNILKKTSDTANSIIQNMK